MVLTTINSAETIQCTRLETTQLNKPKLLQGGPKNILTSTYK